jgi:hypothetical protein
MKVQTCRLCNLRDRMGLCFRERTLGVEHSNLVTSTISSGISLSLCGGQIAFLLYAQLGEADKLKGLKLDL